MPVSIPAEVTFFLYSMLYGAAFFCAYDILRCIRRIFVHTVFWIAVEDLLFWMAAGILLFLMIFDKNSGSLRGFFFFGVVLGAVFWYLLFDRPVLFVLTKILNAVKRIFLRTGRFLGKPAGFLARRFCWTIRFFGKKGKKVFRSFGKYLKKCAKIVKISRKR
jgi:spore cortex biosynthesis protein YabQ